MEPVKTAEIFKEHMVHLDKYVLKMNAIHLKEYLKMAGMLTPYFLGLRKKNGSCEIIPCH